ncbi:MAG: hypothetical protein M9939_03045 [Mesorhizobium sp.]|nr:hypothetical protein [Mesorhizobium sp.]MCO5160085.1 hypothetical protein [Mesorhizobium sp.]
MKTLPILLAGGVLAAAALAPLAERHDPARDYAQRFVACSDRLGPAACEIHLDEWQARPNARQEMIERFATDQAFALHLIALSDARIVTGSIRRGPK